MFLLWEVNAYSNAFMQAVLMINDIFDSVTRPTNSWIINEVLNTAQDIHLLRICVCVCVQTINVESLTKKHEGEIWDWSNNVY